MGFVVAIEVHLLEPEAPREVHDLPGFGIRRGMRADEVVHVAGAHAHLLAQPKL